MALKDGETDGDKQPAAVTMKRPAQAPAKTRGQKDYEMKKLKVEQDQRRYEEAVKELEVAAHARKLSYEEKLRNQKLFYEKELALREEACSKRLADKETETAKMQDAYFKRRLSVGVSLDTCA